MRRAVFAIILVLFANSPKTQLGIFTFSCVVMMAYVIIIKPQKSKMMIILNAAGEGILLVVHIISVAFLNPNLSPTRSN